MSSGFSDAFFMRFFLHAFARRSIRVWLVRLPAINSYEFSRAQCLKRANLENFGSCERLFAGRIRIARFFVLIAALERRFEPVLAL